MALEQGAPPAASEQTPVHPPASEQAASQTDRDFLITPAT
jgi:hypothetical protein